MDSICSTALNTLVLPYGNDDDERHTSVRKHTHTCGDKLVRNASRNNKKMLEKVGINDYRVK